MPPVDAIASWFEREIRPHESILRSWLQKRFPSETDPDDLIQETYVRVLRSREKNPLASPKAYLFAVARNLALHRHRRLAADTALRSELPLLAGPEAETGAAENEHHQRRLALLTEAIQTLPDRCRQIFTLRRIYGLSQAEIAAQLGLSRHTVSSQLSIGLQKCVAYVTAHEPREPTP